MNTVCVFAGSNSGTHPAYAGAAAALGRELARRGLGLVFGGGRIGLMGVLADAVLDHDGRATGIIPRAMVDRELAHPGLTQLRVVSSMHERKALMADLSGAFLALPGGCGTLDELFETFTWAQLGLHTKPIGLLNVEGYYNSLLAFLDRAVQDGFLRADHRAMLLVESSAAALLDRLEGSGPPGQTTRPDEA